MKELSLYRKPLIIAALCIITFICFQYTLHNQFTNWDDDYYVTRDQYIKALTPSNLKVIFTKDITKNNYHPLCMLSLAFNYHFTQLNPMSYYATNIAIHIANTLLIFFLFLQLCKRMKMNEFSQYFIGGFGALWFGIHPMHVESVAWIAERKDVLYAFFFFWGLLAYLRYLDKFEKKWYWITYMLFVASCLSKPMAVMFPVSLICIDFLMQRKIDKRLILEKIVFFFTSALVGGFAVYTQNRTGAIADFGVLTLAERVMYASYSFVMYVAKFFNPSYLSTFYPYPYRFINTEDRSQPGFLHPIYYAAPFIALAIILIPTFIAYKKKSPHFRVIGFGTGFFLANIIFVLQFISVGAAIMADRYSYVAYVGILFTVAYAMNEIIKARPDLKTSIFIILIAFSGWLGFLCYERTFVWHDAKSLLIDATEKYPFKKDLSKPHDSKNSGIALLSYKWLGNYYLDIGDLDNALINYKILDTLRSADDKVIANMNRIYALKNQFGNAVDPLKAIDNKPGANPNYKLYIDSVVAYSAAGDTLKAFRSYINAYKINPGAEKVLGELSFNYVQQQKFVASYNIYSILLKINTSNPFYYFYRGVDLFSTQKMKAAIVDWEIAYDLAVKVKSKDVMQSASYNLSVALDSAGDSKLAYSYLLKAKEVNYPVTPEFEAKIKAHSEGRR